MEVFGIYIKKCARKLWNETFKNIQWVFYIFSIGLFWDTPRLEYAEKYLIMGVAIEVKDEIERDK